MNTGAGTEIESPSKNQLWWPNEKYWRWKFIPSGNMISNPTKSNFEAQLIEIVIITLKEIESYSPVNPDVYSKLNLITKCILYTLKFHWKATYIRGWVHIETQLKKEKIPQNTVAIRSCSINAE